MLANGSRISHLQKSPLVVSVISGKGGVGKSVLTLNLAERAASLGLRTLAIDLSMAGGNLHLMANCAPRLGVEQYLAGVATLSQSITTLSPKCDLLCRTESGPMHAFETVSLQNTFCEQLRTDASEYDLIIVDHGSGMSVVSTTIAKHSDISLLVVVPELTSIADGYGLFKYLTEENRRADCRLVINRAKSESDADYLAEKLVAMADAFIRLTPRVAGWISEDQMIVESLATQRPIAAMGRQSVAFEQIGHIAQVLRNEIMSRLTPFGKADQGDRGGFVTAQTTINNSPASADIKG